MEEQLSKWHRQSMYLRRSVFVYAVYVRAAVI